MKNKNMEEKYLIQEIKDIIEMYKKQLDWPVHTNREAVEMTIRVLEWLIRNDRLNEKE
jgi:hypothetical protein